MWIYKLLQNKSKKTFVIFLIFVLPIIIIFLPYVLGRLNHLKNYDLQTWLSLALAGSWAYLGPYFIFKFLKSIETFKNSIITLSKNTNDVIEDNHPISVDKTIAKIFADEIKSFSVIHRVICFIWIPLIIGILLIFNKRLQDFAFFGFTDLYYWIAIAYISFLLYLQSLGFSGLLTTYRLIRKTISIDYIIDDIMEGSFQDGIKIFGSILIRTTLYFFSGIVFFPILILFAKNQSRFLTLLIIIVMFVFSISILTFFLYSYHLISRNAAKRKNALVEEFQFIYNTEMKKSLCNSYESEDLQSHILKELKIANIYRHIEKLEQINTNPIHFGKVIVTAFTVIFPALFFIKDLLELITYFTSL